MAYSYETIDGQRVEVHVAAAYRRMNAAFTARWGVHLLITSGTRTRAEQAALYDAYLHHGGALAAVPGQSNHEEDGPIGPIALDLRDSGADAGVASGGNPRADWLRTSCGAYSFRPAGYSFRPVEPWHYEYTGKVGGTIPGPTPQEDTLSAAEVNDIKDAIRRDSRARVYKNAKTGKFIAINWDLPAGDPAKILYANGGAAQVQRWYDPYQIVGDSPAQAKVIQDSDWNTLIALAKGTDTAYKQQ